MFEHQDIMLAFWHRGRKQFAEWTSEEIAKRVGIEPTVAGRRLGALATQGLVNADLLPQHTARGWRLTPEGERYATHFLKVQ